MPRVELARRRYREIRPEHVPTEGESIQQLLQTQKEKLLTWLDDDVCTAVEDYWHRPTFREQAAWSLRTLTAGAATEGRRVVETVDRALVEYAKSLLQLATNQGAAERSQELDPPIRSRIERVVKLPADRDLMNFDQRCGLDHVTLRTLVAEIAARFWRDLVSCDDFMWPTANWIQDSCDEVMQQTTPSTQELRRIQYLDFFPSFVPKLHMVGDFVGRCMVRRIQVLTENLRSFHQRCTNAVKDLVESECPALLEIDEARTKLKEHTDRLISFFRGEASRIRDSCVILSQVFITFRDDADWRWLGLSDLHIAKGRCAIRGQLELLRTGELFDRVHAALSDLHELYKNCSPAQSAIEEAIASEGLVLIAAKQQLFWKKELVKVDWKRNTAKWNFIWHLAKKAQLGSHVIDLDVSGEAQSSSTLATLFSRCYGSLPDSLMDLIEPGPERGSYRLNLQRNEIHFFE